MKFDVVKNYDVIILGSGISGLMCALELAKAGKIVSLITKEAVTESSSQYAQGGIAIPLSGEDSVEKHLNDTLQAGSKLCNVDVAKKIISDSVSSFNKLVSYGVKFDSLKNNSIHQTKEAAHSFPRVCHVGGDSSGRYITKILIDKACREQNIFIAQGTVAISVLKDNENVYVLLEDVARNKYIISAKDLIISTGGVGQLFKNTTNPKVSTGDGVAMAYKAGVELRDVEMIQFHPTVLSDKGDPFLITEAIRGEGGKLKNILGEYFAHKYHPQGELAPRDVLSRAIFYEMQKTNSKYVLLDLKDFKEDYFKNRFPTIYQTCIERRIDLFKTGIPVNPGAHYFIGGIRTDISGKTNINGIWAVGEAASNGFHGANRLASNSLLECIVVPLYLANEIIKNNRKTGLKKDCLEISVDENDYDEKIVKSAINELQERNTENLGLIREEDSLNQHLMWLNQISQKFNVDLSSTSFQVQELKNMLLLSRLICNAALERKHSLGVHFRQDFQDLPKEFKHSVYNLSKPLFWEVEGFEKELIAS